MKICIAGSRTLNPTPQEIDYILFKHGFLRTDISEVVSGCAKGADKAGEAFADFYQIKKQLFPADWSRLGPAAGPIRNKAMAEYSDGAIIWWDGESKGTKNMVDHLTKFQKPFILCIVKNGKFESEYVKSTKPSTLEGSGII